MAVPRDDLQMRREISGTFYFSLALLHNLVYSQSFITIILHLTWHLFRNIFYVRVLSVRVGLASLLLHTFKMRTYKFSCPFLDLHIHIFHV